MFNRVLMVCIGNICRSPMAEGLLRRELEKSHPGVKVESAGLLALDGHPADPMSVELLRERGVDISGHKARQLTVEMVREADLILVMDAGQQKALEDMHPAARGKVHRLGKWREQDVRDPYRKPREAFEQCLTLIDQCIADLKRFYP